MKIQNITIVVRGTMGEVKKGVFDIEGKCLSGDPDIKEFIGEALEEHANDRAATDDGTAADDGTAGADDSGDDGSAPVDSTPADPQ